MGSRIKIDRDQVTAFCRRHHVHRLSLFGSVLREDFRPDSDVDVLVQFEPHYRIGFLGMAGMEIELSEILGRKVDLRTPAELSRYFREEVMASAEVAFAA